MRLKAEIWLRDSQSVPRRVGAADASVRGHLVHFERSVPTCRVQASARFVTHAAAHTRRVPRYAPEMFHKREGKNDPGSATVSAIVLVPRSYSRIRGFAGLFLASKDP